VELGDALLVINAPHKLDNIAEVSDYILYVVIALSKL
jgi:hypothetical protein